ncbi:MAG: hypothetical protein GY953_04110 [bacterium]|nr:hypothetical protein [bacterium]
MRYRPQFVNQLCGRAASSRLILTTDGSDAGCDVGIFEFLVVFQFIGVHDTDSRPGDPSSAKWLVANWLDCRRRDV